MDDDPDVISSLLVRSDCTIRQALERLQSTSKGALMMVKLDNTLQRVVTDGDIRRLLLSGSGMRDTLRMLPDQASFFVPDGTAPEDALSFMNAHSIDHLPMVDASGKPVRLIVRREFDSRILLSTPHIGVEEMKFIEEAFRTNWIAPLGPNVDAFEKEIAHYVGASDAAAVSSGTAAIHLGLRLLDVEQGDIVFCSALTFIASVNPVLYLGAQPVFIDSEPSSWNMSSDALSRAFREAKSSGRMPKAVIVVNLYGQSADYDPIMEICDRYGVPVLEDAAESLGATYRGQSSGTFGKVGVYSFNGNKIITTSGGGMLVSNDAELVHRARHLSTQARENAPYYEHKEVGYNYRMSNVLAGIGRGQLKVLEDRVAARRAVFDRYVEALGDFSEIEWMPEGNKGRSTRWLSTCALRGQHSPSEIIECLGKQHVEARRIWKPMQLQPIFRGRPYYPHSEAHDVSRDLFDCGLCLPSGSTLTVEQQERITSALRRLLQD